jgi:hypothetical protein
MLDSGITTSYVDFQPGLGKIYVVEAATLSEDKASYTVTFQDRDGVAYNVPADAVEIMGVPPPPKENVYRPCCGGGV